MSGPFSLSDDELDAMTDTMLDAQERASSTRVLGTGFRDELRACVAKARTELRTKTVADIHAETAFMWCARALVCYGAGKREEGDLFAEEAAEHAAVAELHGCKGLASKILGALRVCR
jgi:hypothetical protein